MLDTTKKPSIKSVTINAEWLRQLRQDLAAGECREFNAMRAWAQTNGRNDSFFYVYKEAADTSQVKVRISATSIALVVNRNNRYVTLLSYHIHSSETIKIADVKAALKAGTAPEGPPQSNRERAKEENDRKYAKRTYNEWFKEYCELVEIHKDIKRFKDRKNYIKNFFLKKPLPARLRVNASKKLYGQLTPGDIDAEAATAWQEDILKNHSKHSARLAKTYLNSMFRYLGKKRTQYKGITGLPEIAVIDFKESELVNYNPLSDEQIARLWKATEKLDPIRQSFVQFLMLTSRRSGETRNLKWEDINFTEKTIAFKAETRKRDFTYLMPMTARVEEILKNTPCINEFVFPTPQGGQGFDGLMNQLDHYMTERPYLEFDFIAAGKKYKAPPRKRIYAPFRWKLHDLRDTAGDIIAQRIGYDFTETDADLIQGHDISGGKAQRRAYNSFVMLPRKRILFERIESYILALVGESSKASTQLSKADSKRIEKLSNDELEAMLASLQKMKHERATSV